MIRCVGTEDIWQTFQELIRNLTANKLWCSSQFVPHIETDVAQYCWQKISSLRCCSRLSKIQFSKIKCPSGCALWSKILSLYRLQYTVKSAHGWLGYFSARSSLNEGVLSAMAIMMWPCGWDGQKQATNFGQTWGQRQTRHTQSEKTLYMKYAHFYPLKLQKEKGKLQLQMFAHIWVNS